MPNTIWIVIVNYRTADLAIECLQSLATEIERLAGMQVVVVDNDSADGSAEKIGATIDQRGWSAWARLVAAERNGGFAYGNNIGIRLALERADPPDYLMLLNPDTVVHAGAVRSLLEFMASNPEVGVAGSLLENRDGGVDCSAHRIHSPLSELDGGARLGPLTRMLQRHVVSETPRDDAHACDWVSGASLVVRREVVEDIGLMDEDFFLYFEEVDFCWRAKKAGWAIWYVPAARVLHLEGASTGIRATARRRAAYWYDSRRRFFIKHYGVAGLVLADVMWSAGRLSFLLRCLLRLGGKGFAADPKWYMWDLLVGDLRALVEGRTWSVKQGMVR